MSRSRLPEMYGPRRTFIRKSDAEQFTRHLTRELTAGGIPHWVEIRNEPSGRFVAFVHRYACQGAAACSCGGIEPNT